MSRARGTSSGLVVAAVATLGACAAPNLSRTLGRGNWELQTALGGPLFTNLGAAIPVPHAHVAMRVGVADRLDVRVGTNATPVAFGVLPLDAGVVFQLWRRPRRLAVSATTHLWTFTDLRHPGRSRSFPELGLHLGRPLGRRVSLHGGATLAYALRGDPRLPALFLTPFVGGELLLGRHPARRHGLAVQASWVDPWIRSKGVVEWVPGWGALGVFVAYRVQFGGLER